MKSLGSINYPKRTQNTSSRSNNQNNQHEPEIEEVLFENDDSTEFEFSGEEEEEEGYVYPLSASSQDQNLATPLNEAFREVLGSRRYANSDHEEVEDFVKDPIINQNSKVLENSSPRLEIFLYHLIRWGRFNFKTLIYTLLLSTLCFLCYLTTSTYIESTTEPSIHIPLSIRDIKDVSKLLQSFQQHLIDSTNSQRAKMQDLKEYIDIKYGQFDNELISLGDQISGTHNELMNLQSMSGNSNLIDLGSDGLVSVVEDGVGRKEVVLRNDFKEYLRGFIKGIIQEEFDLKDSNLNEIEEFINKYLEKYLKNSDQFSKKEISSLVSAKFKESKTKLLKEIKSIVNHQQPKTSTRMNMKKKKNYSLFSSGARLINYLTSPPFNPRTNIQDSSSQETLQSPMIILSDTPSLWKSSEINAQISLRFLEYIHLTELSYTHDLYSDPSGLTSAPKSIELYVEVTQFNDLLKEMYDQMIEVQTYAKTYVHITTLWYEINNSNSIEEEQWFEIPDYIKKYLIKSIMFKINGNHGNEFFTSLYKFYIGGLTKFDILALDQLKNKETNGVHDHILSYYGLGDTREDRKLKIFPKIGESYDVTID